MRVRPLYPEPPLAAIERVKPRSVDPKCSRCNLCTPAVKHPCVGADGEAGGLLVVGESPSSAEDHGGRPMVGRAGGVVRSAVMEHWQGPVAYDLSVRCAVDPRDVEDKEIAACRGYLAKTIAEVKPTRIIAVGSVAARALIGRNVHPIKSRRAYGWLWNDGTPIPVYIVASPNVGHGNRFLAKWVLADLKWALTEALQPPVWMMSELRIVETAADAELACADLRDADWFAWDVETAGILYTDTFMVLCLGAASVGADYVWVWSREALDDTETMGPLKLLLEDKTAAKLGQNEKYDRQSMTWKYGIEVQGTHGDTRLWRKLLDVEADADLDTMAELVGMGGHKGEAAEALEKAKEQVHALIARQADTNHSLDVWTEADRPDKMIEAAIALGAEIPQVAYYFIPRATILRYVARDVLSTARLGALYEAQLAREKPLQRVWTQVVKPASYAVARVEAWGVPASRDRMLAFHTYLTMRLSDVKKRLDHYGTDINWDSNPQLVELLYGRLKLKPPHVSRKTGKPSTDEEALKELVKKHPVAADILEYRGYTKLDNGYATGLMKHVRDDGRIHGSINLDGARSGRTSMSNPNLQNIRRADDEESKLAKDCFVAPPGWVLLSADYSQLELRMAAMLSGDPEMIAIFASGMDYHLRTAQIIAPMVWGITAEQVTKVHRTGAKEFNFGIMFGMNDESIAAKAGCSVAEAAKIRAALFGKMRVLKKWIDSRAAETAQTGEAWTYWDGERARRRPLFRVGDADSTDNNLRAGAGTAKRSAWNTPIQGSASEFCVASLARSVGRIESEGLPAQLVLPVHDSLMFLVRETHLLEVAYEVRDVMTNYRTGAVPLVVDMEVGPSWGSMEKLKLAA
jgi:DNA polymerase-1